jgi:hypothetical protein
VKKEIDCQVFEDQLDALMKGKLSEEGVGQLKSHALSCPDCAMQLRVQEHLALPSLEELEGAVPEELLASVWPTVEDAVRGGGPGGIRGASDASGSSRILAYLHSSWLVPTLAAASVVLLFSTGFLFSELRNTEARESQLAERIGQLEDDLAELNGRTVAVERTAGLASRRPWARAVNLSLGSQESVTVGWLQEMLGNMQPDAHVLSKSEWDDLMGSRFSRGFGRLRVSIPGESIADGLTVAELLTLLEELNLDPDQTVPADRLMDILS